MRNSTRAAITYGIAATLLLVIVLGGMYITSHKTSSTAQNSDVTFIAPPPSAEEIAIEMNCRKYAALDISATAHALGVIDGGTCWKGADKFAINTFKNATARDGWLKISEPFGVNPEWETATSVTYPSIG